ncbi:16S rRNA (cytidine(1402)-2'-O)-methyltransferase [Paenibacillus sp. J2TS4]|uniref:16S rRNA (cytidine(1402)-2'-O)-methyltransferase n=1 Tax=Paenibacillus sp. J2TS4 TaxID=2807194 RepID=UPI001B26D711|nr:16S rRNA (cytidine(1402)-2'-O)-methyltransferase [Paenibacillus sp. J2TS4]GIP36316.1 ribosomal RNA small subunit methyltransferase I [Paenibacillus sp. J2TS4]
MNIQQSFRQEGKAGTLYLVGTPIGNLEDITYRAVRILKEADWIAAEDTRQTRKLLTHLEITNRLVSYHEHNKEASGAELIRRMEQGESVALVSDAGLPAISDPGYELVRAAIEQQIPVVPIPGANAALSALIVSGLPTDKFVFVGFLPRDRKGIVKELTLWKSVQATLLFYESPYRIAKTLGLMLEVWGNREIALVRELTKKYEEVARGRLEDCIKHVSEVSPLGEYCIVVGGSEQASLEAAEEEAWWKEMTLEEHVAHYVRQGVDRKQAIKKAALDRGVPKREVYNQLIQD